MSRKAMQIYSELIGKPDYSEQDYINYIVNYIMLEKNCTERIGKEVAKRFFASSKVLEMRDLAAIYDEIIEEEGAEDEH